MPDDWQEIALGYRDDARRLENECDRYRVALMQIEREDHEHGPGQFAEIAAEALRPSRLSPWSSR